MLARILTRLASPAGAAGGLTVLYLHRVHAQTDPMSPGELTAAQFDTMLGRLKRQFTMWPLDEAVRRLREGRLGAAAAALTFDDGYLDNHAVAAPLLEHHGVPATFFVATGYLHGELMFNDSLIEGFRHTPLRCASLPALGLNDLPLNTTEQRRQAASAAWKAAKYLPPTQRLEATQDLPRQLKVQLPHDVMMQPEQVADLSRRGFGIGAHTVSHPILSRIEDHQALRELREGRDTLAEITGRPVSLLAYPNGRRGQDYDQKHAEMARSLGFVAAFATDPGLCRPETDRFHLPRFTPWNRSAPAFQLQLLRNAIYRQARPA